MFNFFNSEVEVNTDSSGYVTISSYFGSNFYHRLHRLTSGKVDVLFKRCDRFKITYPSFFSFEVYEIMKYLYSHGGYGINKAAILNTLNYLDSHNDINSQPKVSLDLDILPKIMTYQLLDHQLKVAHTYEDIVNKMGYRGMLLYGSVGSGKTMTSLAIAEALHSEKIVIIAPNQTIYKVWIHSLEDELYLKKQPYHLVGTGEYEDERFIISNYEQLPRLIELVDKIKGYKCSVIVDESHNFADPKSNRTKALIEFINKLDSNNNILMSGTPIKSGVAELGTIFSILYRNFNSKEISDSFYNFYKYANDFISNLLQARFGEATAVVKREVLNLEPLTTNYIDVKIPDAKRYTLKNIRVELRKYIKERTLYYIDAMPKLKEAYNSWYNYAKNKLIREGYPSSEFTTYERSRAIVIEAYEDNKLYTVKDILLKVNNFEDNVLVPALPDRASKDIFKEAKTATKYLALKIQGEALANVVMKARIDAHVAMAKEFNYLDVINSTSKKTIIFSNYIDVCNAAYNATKRLKYKPIAVYGDTTKDLNTNVGIFTNNSNNVNPLITTYKSLSTGVPLTAANVVLILDLPFRMYMYEQAIARVWRLGQDEKVYVYILRLDTADEDNINSRNIDIIKFFKEEVEAITGIKTDMDIEYSVVSNEGYKELLGVESYNIDRSIHVGSKVLLGW
jgi:putative SNF2 domain helicase